MWPAVVLAAVVGGCTSVSDAPPAKVEAVTAYGMTLDESATPEQVAFVLLQAIRDDVEAAQARDRERHRQAVELQYAIAAYSTIEERLLGVFSRADGTGDLGDLREQRLYDVVKQWGAIAAHYVRSFDAEFDAAAERLRVERRGEPERVHVLYDVCHDPSATDPAQRQPATLEIELAIETEGADKYWRVARVDFRRPRPAATAPAESG